MASDGQVRIRDMCKKILLDRIESTNKLPWESPLQYFNSFNWATGRPYRGINRLILPFGEYLTSKQLTDYNRVHGTDYRYDKFSTKFFPVVFTKLIESEYPKASVPPSIMERLEAGETVNLSSISWLKYYSDRDVIIRTTRYLQYYTVFERSFCRNSQGIPLPSRITDTKEVEITYSNIDEVLRGYIRKEGIDLYVLDHPESASYSVAEDKIKISKLELYKSTNYWYSSLAHECGHSTGVSHRLKRKSLCSRPRITSKSDALAYIKAHPEYKDITDMESLNRVIDKVIRDVMDTKGYEECVAEFTASFILAECGVDSYEHYGREDSKNHVAYIQNWMSYLRDPSTDIIKIVGDADRAFEYILSATQGVQA